MILQNWDSIHVKHYLTISLSSSPWQPPFYFLWISLHYIPHIKWNPTMSVFWWLAYLAQLFSNFNHVVAVSEFPSFLLFHLYIMPKERSWPTLGGRISDCSLLLDSYWNHLDFVQDTIVNVRNQERDASAIILQTEC